MTKTRLALLVTLAFAGCKKKESTPAAGGSATPPAGSGSSAASPSGSAAAAPTPTPTEDDPCKLLSAEEATAIAKKPMKRDPNVSSSCQYIAEDAQTLSFELEKGEMFEGYSGNAKLWAPLDGVGEKAVWSDMLSQGVVLKGGKVVHVTSQLGDKAAKKATAIELAKQVAGKL